MSLRWEQVVVDAIDPVSLGRWWAAALGWVVVNEDPHEFEIQMAPDHLPGIIFEPASDAKPQAKNRLHMDFRPEDQAAQVQRRIGLGARRVDIGQRIRAVRRHKRMSQEDVANYLGCSRMKVTRVEKGVSEFSVIELELLARFLDVSILHFLGIELTVSFQGDPRTYVIPL